MWTYIQLILEQHKFEPHKFTYTQIFKNKYLKFIFSPL